VFNRRARVPVSIAIVPILGEFLKALILRVFDQNVCFLKLWRYLSADVNGDEKSHPHNDVPR